MSTVDSIYAAIDRLPLEQIEGIWQFGGQGSVIAIVRPPTGFPGQCDYIAVAVSGTNRSLRPGTVIGVINRGGERHSYSATFYASHTPGHRNLSGRRQFTLRLADDLSHLRFIPRHNKLRLYLPALLPGIAGRIVRQGYIDRSVDGCSKVYPEPLIPVEPRYL